MVEVVVAMVILAVGLMGLGALGLGSARMVNRAQRQSQYATAASDTMERVLGRIRARQSIDHGRTFLLGTDTVRIHVDSVQVAITDGVPAHRFDVTVTVTPAERDLMDRSDSLRVVGSVFR